MDGIHDMGGMQGFGPVDTGEPEEPFHAPWEGRIWAIVASLNAPDWTIDWWRHVRELIDPADYLARPYFDQWMQTHTAALIDSGVLTVDEIATGVSRSVPDGMPPPLRAESVPRAARAMAERFSRPLDAAPAYAVGDAVRARPLGATGHTRLPRYVRGRRGAIHAHHGAHLLPDAGARGKPRPEHLYSVVFEAAELWPEAGNRRDRVFLDLWESYLERP